MSRKKDLAKNTAILTFGRICTQFVSFLLLPLYTAILEPEVYGIADLFNSYIYLIIPLVSLMLDQGLFRFLLECREDEKRKKTLLSTVLLINFVEIIIYLLIYMVIQRYIGSQYKIFLLIDVALNILLNTFLQFARGTGKNSVYAISSFLSASMTVVSNVIMLVFLRMGVWGLFVSTVVGRAIALFFAIILLKTWKYFDFKEFSKDEAKRLMSYSLPFIPNQLSWWIISVSDRTIISWFLNVAANGLYSVANKFSSIYITFYNIFNLSWTESVSLHINDKDSEEFLENTINTMFKLFYSICIGIIAYMPLVFPLLINDQYNQAYGQIPILMLAVLFQVIVGLYSVVYVALKKSNEIAKTSFWAAVINIVVNVALINFIGLYAASISTLVSYAMMSVYRYFHIKKYVNVPLHKKGTYLLITVIVFLSYYYNNSLTNIFIASGVTTFAIVSNREFIQDTIKIIFTSVKKLNKKG